MNTTREPGTQHWDQQTSETRARHDNCVENTLVKLPHRSSVTQCEGDTATRRRQNSPMGRQLVATDKVGCNELSSLQRKRS